MAGLNSQIEISGEQLHHLKKVLRLNVGDCIEAVERGSGKAYLCELVAVDREKAVGKITGEISTTELLPITLVMAVVKPKVADFVVEKCVELGVRALHFFHATRSQRIASGDEAHSRLDRLRRLADEATKQAGAIEPCAIAFHDSLERTLAAIHTNTKRLPNELRAILVEPASRSEAVSTAEKVQPFRRITDLFLASTEQPSALENSGEYAESYIVVGPEGGLTREEITESLNMDYSPTSLGPRTLRSETAALLACAMVGLIRHSSE